MAGRSVQTGSDRDGLWRLTERQYGVVTHRQLEAAGYSRSAIGRRLASGRLHAIHRGVYAVGRPELSERGRRLAAVLACGEGALLSHLSAASHWGIWRDGDGRLEVTVPGRRNPRVRGVRVHRRAISDGDVAVHERLPVTSVLRTLLDIAGQVPRLGLEGAVSEADKLGLASPGGLRRALGDRAGQRGAGVLRTLLDEATFATTDSDLERLFLPLARRAGLPKPETGARLHRFKVDFLWREIGLVVETDGLRYHRTPTQQARDRRRDQAMAEHGLTTLRFTHAQVTREPAAVEHTLRVVAARLRGAALPRPV